ncbi:spermidine/putrescine ABC transporter substrate-binding protein [Microbacterium sp.]|uniref:ABC transporter substrate-binding protein n=1 Tax=Microbacterium sp. TaxID=51671 RepID=UPI0031FE81CE|nr:spermidine/putrescine ABC transporter substrate-binding protein [Microbacterium sp.]
MTTRRPLSPLAVIALIGAFVLSACGISPTDSGDGGTSQEPGASDGGGEPVGGGEPEDVLNFANWPLYIDQDDDGNPVTILDFEEATGIDVTYTESIEDNTSFFGTIQPALAGGEDTGYDIIVVTDWMIGNLARLGYLEKLDVERDIPNFVANADPVYLERSYDPDNQYSVPYQSGITGIAYNPELVDEEITSMAQLLDPELIEKYCGQIGMFIEMRDSMSFAMLYNGVIPAEATMEDVEAAQQTLLEQAPCVRGYYGNEYADDLANGSIAITMAWSGDVFQLQFDNPDLQFVVPDEGAILWTDNMAIPKGAEHPNAALAMMDYLYDPENAAQVAEWVNYITPVPGAKEIILQHADEAADEGDTETEEYLRAVAESPLVFPTQDMLDRLYSYKVLDEEEERQWNELFQEVVQG